jgi:4-alpha-glucanotransferase
MLDQRSAGVLLHITCLPSPLGTGDLGPSARAYVDWLADAGATWWQILPLHPPGPGNSPYSAHSTFAGSELLISPEIMAEQGLLSQNYVINHPEFNDNTVEFAAVAEWRKTLLRRAFERLEDNPLPAMAADFELFGKQNAFWLDDYSMYSALKSSFSGADFRDWPEQFRRRDSKALSNWRSEHEREIRFVAFCQFQFFRQLELLRDHARSRGVKLLGDVPIFVAPDSADVWAHPEVFRLDDKGNPEVVAGVPPDYFSETGQLWGNPLYDWEELQLQDFDWWVARLKHALTMVDAVRLDHFRGFTEHWEVPAHHDNAVGGSWHPGPGLELFKVLRKKLGSLPFIAEDLGFITEEVNSFRRQLGLPGMTVLHFAFSPHDRSIYIPYAHEKNQVVYTGTHDNNTSIGWYLEDASEDEKDFLRRYTKSDGSDINWDLVRVAMESVADLAIVPHQDLAGLGSDCRMNIPGKADGNWGFRITRWMLGKEIKDRFAELIWLYGRKPRKEESHQ